MAAPTQAYPPWLTPSPFPTTLPDGDVVTETTIVYLPLTYYGPSIPLGDLYTYGGLTSPASSPPTPSPTTSTSSAIPTSLSSSSSSSSPSTSFTSSSASSSPSSSPTSSSSSPSSASPSSSFSPTSSSTTSSSSSLQSSQTTSTPSTSLSSTPEPSSSETASPTGAQSRFPNRAQLAGLIVGAVLLALFIIISIYLCVTRFTSRREMRRAGILPAFFGSNRRNAPDEDFEIIHHGDASPPPGSPRESGEEADPFLDRSRRSSQALTAQQMAELGIRPPSFGYPRNTGSSSTTSYGTEIPSTVGFMNQRHIISPEEQQRLDSAISIPEAPEPDEDAPLMPPPRLVTERNSSTPILPGSLPISQHTLGTNSSLPPDADEAGMLQTARRVRIDDQLGDRTTAAANLIPSSEAVHRRDAGWLGLSSLANLGRLSWFRGSSESGSQRNSGSNPSSSWYSQALVDRDVESSRPLLTTPSNEFRSSRGIIGVGVGPAGERPRSGAESSANSGAQSSMNSAKSNNSGNTVYHDALESLPDPPPPPAAYTTSSTHRASPLQYSVTNDPDPSTTAPAGDVLDIPAPPPLRHFASTSSVKDTATINTESSITSKKFPAFPPGLPMIPKIWTEDPAPHGGITANSADVPPNARTSVGIDILEEEPPMAQQGWHRVMGVNLPGLGFGAGRRTTFGGIRTTLPPILHSPTRSSEHGSLHSNISHDHLTPAPSRSVGSSGASSRRSRRTGSSSLNHSGSISEDGRRRVKLGSTNRSDGISPPMSPALSAVGEMSGPSISPMPQARMTRAVSPNSVSQIPWAGGLDNSWNPT